MRTEGRVNNLVYLEHRPCVLGRKMWDCFVYCRKSTDFKAENDIIDFVF
jgi:hypothetical protein